MELSSIIVKFEHENLIMSLKIINSTAKIQKKNHC